MKMQELIETINLYKYIFKIEKFIISLHINKNI